MSRRSNYKIKNYRNRSLSPLECAELHVTYLKTGSSMTAIKYLHRIFAAWDGEPAFCEIIVSSSMAIIISDIFSCVRIIVIRRCSVCREDTTSRSGLWRICLAFRISKKAGTDITEEEKDPESMSFEELQRHIAKMMKQMNQAAAELNFEKAAKLRDRMIEYKKHLEEIRSEL